MVDLDSILTEQALAATLSSISRLGLELLRQLRKHQLAHSQDLVEVS